MKAIQFRKRLCQGLAFTCKLFSRRRAPVSPQLRMIRKFTPGDVWQTISLCGEYDFMAYHAGIETEWAELLNGTGELGAWNRDRLNEDIVNHLLPGGAVFAAEANAIVACAAACRITCNEPYGTLMYVGVNPQHRNRGLGRAVTYGAMLACYKAGCPGMVLSTDEFRIPAIRTYFSLGFEPFLASTGTDAQRWKQIRESVMSKSQA